MQAMSQPAAGNSSEREKLGAVRRLTPVGEQAEWVRAAQRGDDEAFYRLVSDEQEKLYRMAVSLLRSEADALEAVQETTFRAYSKLAKLKEPQFFATWLMRILINYCMDEHKRRGRSAVLNDEAVLSSGDESGATDRIALDIALQQLEPKLRQVVILKYFEDQTIRDIARTLGSPDSTIKTWLYKGLRGLRGLLRHEEEE